MQIRYDLKGKYFTQVVNKQQVQVILQTSRGEIRGVVHVQPDQRLLDELNSPGDFLPVTGAAIIQSGERVEAEFVAVRKDQIVWIRPIDQEPGENS
jgi:hypothetical protein